MGSGDPCLAPALCSENLDACVQCLTVADCADGNICTDDLCDAFGACSNPNNTLPCVDGPDSYRCGDREAIVRRER